jgi:hypothetical protein
MQGKKSLIWMLALVAAGYTLSVDAGSSNEQATKWNEKAASVALDKESLAKLGEPFPAWKIKQATWPSVTELSSASVTIDDEIRASCVGWLKKYLKKEYLPAEIIKHLVPMKNWGVIRKASEQKRLCDVFIVRFTKGPYVIHIQESPFNVVISIVDGRIVKKKPKADHKDLILQTAAAVLHKDIVPDPAKGLYERKTKAARDGGTISGLIWRPPSVVGKDKEGRGFIKTDVAAKIGTFEIYADTDGAFVRFDIVKSAGVGPMLVRDPYVQRFSPPK